MSTLAESTPERILDALRDHPEWDDRRRDEELDRLVAGFDADRLLAAARGRLNALGQADGEAVLRIIEAFGGPEDLRLLAAAVSTQPDLAPERLWEVLELLEGSGLIERFPNLLERRDDLDEVIEGQDDVLGDLATQIEEADQGPWLALQGLGAIEPAVRVEILEDLAARPAGPGMVEFFRLLAFAFEPGTRAAAIRALEKLPDDAPGMERVWASLGVDHPDPAIRKRSRARAGSFGKQLPALSPPRLVRSLVSTLDGEGLGCLAIMAEDRGSWVSAAFACDLREGIVEVFGQIGDVPSDAGRLLDDLASEPGREVVEGAHELALTLLFAGLAVSGPKAPPALRYWLERTVGSRLSARPLAACLPPDDGFAASLEPPNQAAEAILEACPTWVDTSNLTYEIADELRLRNRTLPPDPRRDAGAFRFLFENRLHERLGLLASMLAWMAAYWRASGSASLARSAANYARELSDPQHAVPAHPFVAALAARSLAAAQANLAQGLDFRDPGVRRRVTARD